MERRNTMKQCLRDTEEETMWQRVIKNLAACSKEYLEDFWCAFNSHPGWGVCNYRYGQHYKVTYKRQNFLHLLLFYGIQLCCILVVMVTKNMFKVFQYYLLNQEKIARQQEIKLKNKLLVSILSFIIWLSKLLHCDWLSVSHFFIHFKFALRCKSTLTHS